MERNYENLKSENISCPRKFYALQYMANIIYIYCESKLGLLEYPRYEENSSQMSDSIGLMPNTTSNHGPTL